MAMYVSAIESVHTQPSFMYCSEAVYRAFEHTHSLIDSRWVSGCTEEFTKPRNGQNWGHLFWTVW